MDRYRERRMRSPLAVLDDRAEDLVTAPGRGAAQDGFLSLDMYETDTSFVIRAALPGLSAEDLKITREGRTLTLEGELVLPEPDSATYLFRERWRGHFSRTLPLPESAAEEVNATLESGVLSLEFAKPSPRTPRTIKVNTAG
ncbi:MAG: Hsp20/alpha crystallin family protein [Chloroflexi bacterium]|nr:Hsp20/alpha crystallin family protein [Chloroflexota bacterium]